DWDERGVDVIHALNVPTGASTVTILDDDGDVDTFVDVSVPELDLGAASGCRYRVVPALRGTTGPLWCLGTGSKTWVRCPVSAAALRWTAAASALSAYFSSMCCLMVLFLSALISSNSARRPDWVISSWERTSLLFCLTKN